MFRHSMPLERETLSMYMLVSETCCFGPLWNRSGRAFLVCSRVTQTCSPKNFQTQRNPADGNEGEPHGAWGPLKSTWTVPISQRCCMKWMTTKDHVYAPREPVKTP